MAVLGASLNGSTVGRFWHAAWHEVTFAAPDTVLLLGAADVRGVHGRLPPILSAGHCRAAQRSS